MSFDFTDPRLYRPRAALYALAFEEAGKALAWQERILADLRARGVGLAGTATVTTTISGGPLGAAEGSARYVAVAAFVGVSACALGLLWPRHFDDAIDAQALLERYTWRRQACRCPSSIATSPCTRPRPSTAIVVFSIA